VIMLTWLVRLAAGAVSLILAISGNGILMETAESVDSPSWAIPLAIAFHLSSGLLAFGVFFRWQFSRINGRGSQANRHPVRRHERTVGAMLVGIGMLAGLVALLAVLGLAGEPSAAPGTVAIIVFLLIVSLVSVGTGVGLRKEASWSRRAALFSGFLFFGGVPVGTVLALTLWWLAAQRPNPQMDAARAGV